MGKLNDRKRNTFLWALSLSAGFPAGIAMTAVGFVKGGGYIAMGVSGIVLIILGFYVMPLLWIHFGTLSYYISVARHINDGIRSASMLASQHNKKKNDMVADIKTMIQKNYLPGFIILDDETIVDKNTMKKNDYSALEAEREGKLSLVHCPFCNAKFQMLLDVGECPYCKSKVTKEMLGKNLTAYNKSSADITSPQDNAQ